MIRLDWNECIVARERRKSREEGTDSLCEGHGSPLRTMNSDFDCDTCTDSSPIHASFFDQTRVACPFLHALNIWISFILLKGDNLVYSCLIPCFSNRKTRQDFLDDFVIEEWRPWFLLWSHVSMTFNEAPKHSESKFCTYQDMHLREQCIYICPNVSRV